MFDAHAVFRFAGTGIMLDYVGAAVLFGRSHTGKQNRRCHVASLCYSSVQIFMKGFMISSTRVDFFFFFKLVLNQMNSATAVKSEPEEPFFCALKPLNACICHSSWICRIVFLGLVGT